MFRNFVPLAVLLAICGSIALSSSSPTRAQEASPASTETAIIAEQFIEALNSVFATGDASALDDVVATDYVNHTPSPTRSGGLSTPDLSGLKSSFEAVHAVFPDAEVTIDESIVEGARAALLVTFDGLRGPDTESVGVIIIRVAYGRVIESWNFEEGGTARMQPIFEATPAA